MEHPSATHSLAGVFHLASEFHILPSAVLDMDGEIFLQFMEYLGGVSRGREIAAGRP